MDRRDLLRKIGAGGLLALGVTEASASSSTGLETDLGIDLDLVGDPNAMPIHCTPECCEACYSETGAYHCDSCECEHWCG